MPAPIHIGRRYGKTLRSESVIMVGVLSLALKYHAKRRNNVVARQATETSRAIHAALLPPRYSATSAMITAEPPSTPMLPKRKSPKRAAMTASAIAIPLRRFCFTRTFGPLEI